MQSVTPRPSRSACSWLSASIAVASTNVQASALSTTHLSVPGLVGEREHALAEVFGVDEEGRGVEAVDEQAIVGLGALEALDVVVAIDVLDAAEHGIVRSRGAVDEYADRKRDRDDDAFEHAEDEHAPEGDERETDLGGTYAAQAPDRADVDQAGGCDDDDHAERRLRQRFDQRHREEQKEPYHRSGDHDRSLRFRAAGVVDSRA